MLPIYNNLSVFRASVFFLIVQKTQVTGVGFFPGLNYETYSSIRDLNIGSLLPVSVSDSNIQCSNRTRDSFAIFQYMEAMAFGVQKVNKDPTLLPNITLGFVTLDVCRGVNLALAQSLSFLPKEKTVCHAKHCDLSTNTPTTLSTVSLKSDIPESHFPHHYDVIGVIGPTTSSETIPISQLYSVARHPIISYRATSDELSDKDIHPYLLRVVPPDKIQVLAMLRFIADNNWSYISVVYADRNYGENGFQKIKNNAEFFKICIATSHALNADSDYSEIVSDLIKHHKARVVIAFTGSSYAFDLLSAIQKAGHSGKFIWIGSDAWGDSMLTNKTLKADLNGAFTFTFHSRRVEDFFDHLSSIRLNESSNPWLKSYVESQENCSFQANTCNTSKSIIDYKSFKFSNITSLCIDCVYTFAHAAHSIIEEHCPGAQGEEARNCITGELLKVYMFNASFQGFTGKIAFDRNGNMIGKYQIRQIVFDMDDDLNNTDMGLKFVQVGSYITETKAINYTGWNITWDHLLPPKDENPTGVPESVCSVPCRVHYAKKVKDKWCCWDCKACRPNEILVDENTDCQPCDLYTWPDPESNYTKCLPIPLTYPSMSETLPLIQMLLGFSGIIALSGVVSAYIYRRHDRVIKAASRELSILQMTAMFVGYLTVILMQTPPTHELCGVCYFLFCLSFAWLYSPLIVKTVRIYRIFRSGTRNRRPRYVSPRSQIIIASLLIAIQVVLCAVMYILYTPTAVKTQYIETKNFVELCCDMTLQGLASFLTYNLVLVSLCSVFAFKTRKLPDNFNESRFISMCVSTTLVIWLAFIPTYFTSTLNSVRILLLSLALLLNHTVALVFLFLPKIYAAIYVSSQNIHATRFHTNSSTLPNNINKTPSNRVGPIPTPKPSVFPE